MKIDASQTGNESMPQDRIPFSAVQEARKERHAVVSAESAARRKAMNSPRRDDVARLALFLLLMQYRATLHDSARVKFQTKLLDLLTDAGYSREEAAKAFNAMVQRAGVDLDSYLMKREINRKIRNKWRVRNGLPELPLLSAADKE